MAFDKFALSSEIQPYLPVFKLRDFTLSNVKTYLYTGSVQIGNLSTVSWATVDGYRTSGHLFELPCICSLGTEINIFATGVRSVPDGMDGYPQGHYVFTVGTLSSGGTETNMCLASAYTDETITANRNLYIYVNIEESHDVFRVFADFDGNVTQGILEERLLRLSEVSRTGSYNDLVDVPTRLGQFLNDTGYLTDANPWVRIARAEHSDSLSDFMIYLHSGDGTCVWAGSVTLPDSSELAKYSSLDIDETFSIDVTNSRIVIYPYVSSSAQGVYVSFTELFNDSYRIDDGSLWIMPYVMVHKDQRILGEKTFSEEIRAEGGITTGEDVVPSSDGVIDIGSSSAYYRSCYAKLNYGFPVIGNGVCTSSSDTVEKTVTVFPAITSLVDGMCILVWFTYGNYAYAPTLNVNGIGAYPIQNSLWVASGDYPEISIQAGIPILLCFRNNMWIKLNNNADTVRSASALRLDNPIVSDGIIHNGSSGPFYNCTCDTAANVSKKVITCPYYNGVLSPSVGMVAVVKFTYANTTENPTLMITGNDTDSDLPIYDRTGNNRQWNAGDIVALRYDGSFWARQSLNMHSHYVTCSTPVITSAKVVTIAPRGFVLEDGAELTINFPYGDDSEYATLNVNGTGAKPLYIYDVRVNSRDTTDLTVHLNAGLHRIVYDKASDRYNIVSQTFVPSSMYATEANKLTTERSIDGVSFDGSSSINHYTVCDTAANVQTKEVTLTDFSLVEGARILIKFTYTNTASNPTLKVNSLEAVPLMLQGTTAISDSVLYYRWQAGDIVEFVYDGTNFVAVRWPRYAYSAYSSTNAGTATIANRINAQAVSGQVFNGTSGDFYQGTCSTASATTPKVVTCSGFTLSSGAVIAVTFTNANSLTTLKMNVNGTGDKTLSADTDVITWNAGETKLFRYNGSAWYAISLNKTSCYGTCTTAAATVAKTATVDGSFMLYTGAEVVIRFTYANTASSPTLNVNGTGAKPLIRYGTNKVGTTDYVSWLANGTVRFVYDGTNWVWVGFQYYAYNASRAETWKTARSFTITDADGTNTGDAVSVNGSGDVTLKLPSTIKATLSGSVSSATSATYANYLRNGTTNVLYASSTTTVRPASDNSKYLGSSSYRFKNIYSAAFTGDLTGNASSSSMLKVLTCSASSSTANITLEECSDVGLYLVQFTNSHTNNSSTTLNGAPIYKPSISSSNLSLTRVTSWNANNIMLLLHVKYTNDTSYYWGGTDVFTDAYINISFTRLVPYIAQ